jgi:hypothetical protein
MKCLKKLRETKKKAFNNCGKQKNQKLVGIFFCLKKQLAAVLTDAKSPEKCGIKLQIATVCNCRKNQRNRR